MKNLLTFISPAVLITSSISVAQNTPLYDPKLEFSYVMPNGAQVDLLGPKIHYTDVGESEFDWKVVSSALSPDGKFMAVHYLGSRPKYWDAVVYLVGPDGSSKELSSSKVKEVKWTDDGKYLIGFGDNTIRIWNTSGKRRQVSFGMIDKYAYRDKLLCIEVTNYNFDNNEQQTGRTIEVYAVPTLKKLASNPFVDIMSCNK